MANHKPLPALPQGLDLTTLSVEARNHRARLIGHFLSDLHEPTIESRRDGWLYVFEEVLDDLSLQISGGKWLDSIKRGKAVKRAVATVVEHSRTSTDGEKQPPPSRKGSSDDAGKEGETAETTKAVPDEPEPVAAIPPFVQLRNLSSRPALPPGEPRAGHLVLCLAPHGSRVPLPTEDSGFDIVPANIGCLFSAGTFILRDQDHDDGGSILYGLEGLEGNVLDTQLRLVGGTFALKGVGSPAQHNLLFKVLKLAIYVHLSLILEQHVLFNSGVHLKFPRPKFPPSSPSSPIQTPVETSVKEKEVRIKEKNFLLPSRFTNFFSKRNLSYRGAQTIGPPSSRGSLDLVYFPSAVDHADEPAPRKSIEEGHFGGRLRRFSFMGEKRYSFLRGQHHRETSQDRDTAAPQPFTNALKRIDASKGLLSTSTGVTLTLPKVLVDLAEKERERLAQSEKDGVKHARRLKGDEKVALTSILGWDGKDAEGRGMSGILGFVRQQEISVLFSLHVPPSTSNGTQLPPSTSNSNATESQSGVSKGASTFTTSTTDTALSSMTTCSNLPAPGLSPCGKPHWVTYRYYSSTPEDDRLLGDWVLDVAKRRNSPCTTRPGCTFLSGQHERRTIHDGVRIVVRVTEEQEEETELAKEVIQPEDKEDVNLDGKVEKVEEKTSGEGKKKKSDDDVQVWESCTVCNAKTSKKTLSNGSFLFSYAKFLEMLIYSPALCTLTPTLCEHTAPPPLPWNALPASRLNIIRHFSVASADVTFALSAIEDIFELRVPRLQITRGTDKATPAESRAGEHEFEGTDPGQEQKKALRKEIRRWWEGVSDHIDKIEKILNATEHPLQKALPRLPSVDDAYDVFEHEDPTATAEPTTPTPSTPFPLPPLPPTTPHSPSVERQHHDSYFTTISNISTDSDASQTPTVPPKDNTPQLLALLRHNFQRIEQSLYAQLAKTSEASLNDVRRAFLATGKGTRKRLKAWQDKHLSSSKSKAVGDLVAEEPEWWGKGNHVVPGGNVIVREHDWGSIIAHTLSTVDYQLEMANLSAVRSGSHPSSTAATTPSTTAPTTTSSFFSVATGYRLFTSSSKNQPDPDQENVVWNEPEQYSAVISRKEHARDPTTLISIRDVLRQKADGQPNSVGNSASRFISLPGSNASAQNPSTGAPAAVKVKADVALNTVAAGGLVNGPDAAETAGKLLHGFESEATPTTSRPGSIKSEAPSATSSSYVDTHIRRGKTSSIISKESTNSQATVQKDATTQEDMTTPTMQPSALPPDLPPKDESVSSEADAPPAVPSKIIAPPLASPSALQPTSSGFANVLATGLNHAMRYVMPGSEPSSRPMSPSMSGARKTHGLLLAEMNNIDDRPHIKYDWTIGKRVKFSCTVYYAKQFDVLRRKCGIHNIFLKSLSSSTNWAAEGGKSKSNFWKTSDDRFIIKTLVDAWNVADLQVLIEHAPSYFRYMDATASKPTVLAKLMGFFTIEIKNMETGNVQAKADLLVMENLFFGQQITKTFDLKGIQGRKVKTHGNSTKTLFDGEWIEGQQKTLTLVRPHSKAILRDAIKSDADFLSKSNIMDYSLLLGVDEEKKEIACGLVDTIGSYTFAKTLEYKAKQGLLQSSKEVTVMPPAEYQERFVNTLQGYFVACPDKWSKPVDESKIINDPELLPSVL